MTATPTETWEPLRDAEGALITDYYEVSSLGNVRSWASSAPPHPDGTRRRLSQPKPVTAQHRKNGTWFLFSEDDGKRVGRQARELVAWAFLGPPPATAQGIEHVDGDERNDAADNLAYTDEAITHEPLEAPAPEPFEDLPSEVWKPARDRDGRPLAEYYEVSDLGRIRSWRNGRHDGRLPVPRLLRGTEDGDGYVAHKITLDDGTRHLIGAHQLVAWAFLGPQPPPPPEHLRIVVRHLNDVPGDNRAVNLAYGTDADNADDRKRNEAEREAKLTAAVTAVLATRSHTEEGNSPNSSTSRRSDVAGRVDRRAASATTQESPQALAPTPR